MKKPRFTMSGSSSTPDIHLIGNDSGLELVGEIFTDAIEITNPTTIGSKDRTGVFFVSGVTFDTLDQKTIMDAFCETNSFLIVLPPFEEDSEIEFSWGSDASIAARSRSTVVQVQRSLQHHVRLVELTIVSRHVLKGAGGLTLATDDADTSVIKRFQPSSTDGGVVISTVELASIELQSDETHRRDLLEGLIDYIASIRVAEKQAMQASSDEDQVTLPDRLINNALLALYTLDGPGIAKPDLTADQLRAQLPDRFTFNPSDAEWTALLEYLDNEGLFDEDRLRTDVLLEQIDSRRLEPYLRRLDA